MRVGPRLCKAPAARVVTADLQEQVAALTRELKEARQQQAATSEVLQVVSSSAGELAPVFESLLASAKHLCGAEFGAIFLREGDGFRIVALHAASAEYTEARWHAPFIRPAADTGLGRVLETKQVVQIADVRAVAGYVDNPVQAPVVQLAGVRSKLSVPILKEEELIGVIEIDRQEILTIHRQAGRAGTKLCGSGRHRHREYAAAQRAAPAYPRPFGICRSNRPLRPRCLRLLARRLANWSRY